MIRIYRVIGFIFCVLGGFVITRITPKTYILDIIDAIKKLNGQKKENLEERIKKAKKIKKITYIERLINETKEIMINNGTISKFNKILIASVVCCFIGILVSILLNNIFMLPILTSIFGLIPFYYIRIQNIIYKNEVKKELETALSNITSSYMRYNTTFLEAVKENIDNIRYPLKASFIRFVVTTEHINSNTKENLEQLKNAINDYTYREWIDGIIASEEDYNLKATLPNITNKFSDMRIVNNELSTKMYKPMKEYIMMVVLTVISIPLFYLFNKEAVSNYLSSSVGKIEMSLIFIVIIIVSAKAMNELKPAEYRS